MTTDPNKILAGVAGNLGTPSLAWFADGVSVAPPVGVAGTAGVETVSITGTPTGGTFTLSYNGAVTAPLPYTATAAAVQTALQALAGVGAGKVTVTGGPGPGTPWVATFDPSIGQYVLVGNGAALTPSGAVTVVNTTPGIRTTNPATALLPVTYADGGLIADTGLTRKLTESAKQVFAYGLTSAVRTLISQSATAFDLSFMETNAVAEAIYNRKALSAVVPDSSGYFLVTTGPAQLPHYSAIFDIVDGANHVRFVCPNVANTTPGNEVYAPGSALEHPVSMTAYPDSTGVSIYKHTVVAALGS
jgi:hypothetical protein